MSADGPVEREAEAQEDSRRYWDEIERLDDRGSLRSALLDIARSHVDAMRVCQHVARSNQFGFDRVPHCVFCGAVMP